VKLDPAALLNTVTLADGGWSTQLLLRGLPSGTMAELANLTHPELVAGLARDYVAAGARFITTNTFSANRFTLARHERRDDLAEINRRGAEIVREAVGDQAVITGSLGPSGKILAVREISAEDLCAAVREQAEALAAGGVDAIVLETYSELAEITLALETVKDATGLPVICSMSYDAGPQRTRTMMGAAAGDCAAALEEAGADVIGCNCGSGIEYVLPAVVALRAGTSRPLWVKPNAGMPELEEGRPVWRQSPEDYANFAPQLVEAGVNVIGGCCGSGPEHIRRVAAVLARRKRQ